MTNMDFDEILGLYWHCESRDADSASDLCQSLKGGKFPLSMDEFAQLLDMAISEKTYSVCAYEKVVGADCTNEDEIVEDLVFFRDMLNGRITLKRR